MPIRPPIASFGQWITDGTPWGDEHDPTLASIQVEPAERILAAGESQQLKVVARYSDGSTRDVSPTAEYFSQRPTHLTVSFDGLVHSLGDKGDATVMVRYMGIVAVSRMTIPYTDKSRSPTMRSRPPPDSSPRISSTSWCWRNGESSA